MITTPKKKHKSETSYSPSVNIVRDFDVQLNYIPTPNSKYAYNQLAKNYGAGIHSFCIVGAYGIGKSAFLWAFEKNINAKQAIFSQQSSQFGSKKSFEFVGIVGQYSSITDSVAKEFGLPRKKDFSTKDIISGIDKQYKTLSIPEIIFSEDTVFVTDK